MTPDRNLDEVYEAYTVEYTTSIHRRTFPTGTKIFEMEILEDGGIGYALHIPLKENGRPDFKKTTRKCE